MRQGTYSWLCIFCYILTSFGASLGSTPEDLIVVESGTLPVLIVASHGGVVHLSGVSDRPCVAIGSCPTDINTHLFAKELRDQLSVNGDQPYLVYSDVTRHQVDFNSLESSAYDDPLLEPFYDYYHAALTTFVTEIVINHGHGLLIDVHGHGDEIEVNSVYRGTQNGSTYQAGLNTFGVTSLTGPESVLGKLAAIGYDVLPDMSLPFEQQVEDPRYDGGFVVQTYANPSNFDTLQVELGRALRDAPGNPDAWQQTAADFAVAVDTYQTNYLPAPEPIDVIVSWLLLGVVAIRCGIPRCR